jgi:hypothetical protein
LREGRDDDGRIVGSTGGIREGYETVGDGLRVRRFLNSPENCVCRNSGRQTVGAKQQNIAVQYGKFCQLDIHSGMDSHGAGQDMSMRRIFGIFGT